MVGWRTGFGLAMITLCAGCDELEGLLGVVAPTGTLAAVDLREAPTVEEVLAWQCDELNLGLLCVPVGPRPRSKDLAFQFDLGFDLDNPNITLQVPLVEALLGVTVFDTSNLGSVCVSFCDPADDSCEAETDRPGACEVDDDTVPSPADLVPTLPDLVNLAVDSADGAIDNDDWRTLRAGGTTRVTLGFSLAPETVLGLAETLLIDSLDELLAGRIPALAIPYSTEGTLFFEVPQLGRSALGFGPFEDDWVLEVPTE